MTKKIIITAGQDFTDIDILACAISYNELLQKEGKDSRVVLPGEFNKSITQEINSWNFKYQKTPPAGNFSYIIVDISQPEHLADFVDQSEIIELYDHHYGHEKVWIEKINGKVIIEPVGCCATLIWEEYKKRGFENQISNVSANLISVAIVSNTLNFKASVTNNRDIAAYNELNKFTNLKKDWVSKYFKDQESALFKNPEKEIINDTHVEKFPNSEEKLIIGQIELWNSKEFIHKYRKEIKSALTTFGSDNWFLTSPSISESKNYIYTESEKIKNLLEKEIGAKFEDDVGTTDKLYLRKEIKKIIYKY